ncbi:hypothetical protein Tco_1479587, partial [Tanacetum coccineum]
KGSGSKQTPAKNPDAPVTKGELGNEIKRIMSERLPTNLAIPTETPRLFGALNHQFYLYQWKRLLLARPLADPKLFY